MPRHVAAQLGMALADRGAAPGTLRVRPLLELLEREGFAYDPRFRPSEEGWTALRAQLGHLGWSETMLRVLDESYRATPPAPPAPPREISWALGAGVTR